MANLQANKRIILRPSPYSRKLLADEIADILREAIVSENFEPGEKLKEDELASMLEVSRTPIRQAFKILEFEGLVELFPRRGAYVSRLNQTDAEELYAMLGMMEGFACSQIIAQGKADLSFLDRILARAEGHIRNKNLKEVINANLEFHQMIVEMAGNRRLFSMYIVVRKPTRIFQSIGLSSPEDWRTSLRDHIQIVNAIRDGQAVEAAQICLEHNIKSCNRVISRFFNSSEK